MKNLFAIACCTAACAATAQTGPGVTLTGVADAFAGRMRMAGDTGGVPVLNGGGLSTSWYGFAAVEDLGGGLRSSVRLSSFFRTDTGALGRFENDLPFAREANVALSGGFGTVTLGRSSAPNLVPSISSNPFAESMVFSPLMLHSNVNTARWTRRTTPADTGWSNQIVYTTPTVSGLRAALHYQLGEQNTGTPAEGRKNIGFNAFYNAGPLSLTGYYERDQISNPINNAPIVTPVGTTNVLTTKKVWMVGGAYDAGLLKAYASFGRSNWDVQDFDSKTTSVGVSVPARNGNFLGAVARTSVSGPASATRTTSSVGYDYFLSKRTDVYAVAMRDAVTSLSAGTSIAFGLRHRF